LGTIADDSNRDREELVSGRRRVHDCSEPATVAQRIADAGERPLLVREVDQPDTRDRRVERVVRQRVELLSVCFEGAQVGHPGLGCGLGCVRQDRR